jgi:hypothetical protein
MQVRMRRLLVLVALVLIAAPPASAKGPFQICGSSGCATLGDEAQPPIRFGTDATDPAVAVAPPAPYFVIRFQEDTASPPLAYWVPSASKLKFWTGTWVTTLPNEDAVLREKTAGLTAYPAPQGVTAYVDYEPVKRATGWLKLFAVGKPVTLNKPRGWYEVWLRGGRSPWNDGSAQIWVSRTGNYLMRDGVTLMIPKQVADRIRRRLPLG